MSLTQISREQWKDVFDHASKSLSEQPTTVEVTGLGLGDRIAADHAPLHGISYEPRDDTLTLFLQGLEHRIRHPKTIHADRIAGDLVSFEVVDAEGTHHIVQLSQPVHLD